MKKKKASCWLKFLASDNYYMIQVYLKTGYLNILNKLQIINVIESPLDFSLHNLL